jgi:hypothetical protein
VGGSTLVFRARAKTYQDGGVYGDRQPRGLVAGSGRANAIEFISAAPNTVGCRTVSGGVATQTTVNIGQSLNAFQTYQIVATATEVKFYVNGTLTATHTTNIPTAPLNVYFSTSDSCSLAQLPVSIDQVIYERIPQ